MEKPEFSNHTVSARSNAATPRREAGRGGLLQFAVTLGFIALVVCYSLRVDGNNALFIFLGVVFAVVSAGVAGMAAVNSRLPGEIEQEIVSPSRTTTLSPLGAEGGSRPDSGNSLVLEISIRGVSFSGERSRVIHLDATGLPEKL